MQYPRKYQLSDTLKHSYAIKPVPKPVPSLLRPIRPLHNLEPEKYDTAAHFIKKTFADISR